MSYPMHLHYLENIISWFDSEKPSIEMQTPDIKADARMNLFVTDIHNIKLYAGYVSLNRGNNHGYTVWAYKLDPISNRYRFYSMTHGDSNNIRYKKSQKLYKLMQNLYISKRQSVKKQ